MLHALHRPYGFIQKTGQWPAMEDHPPAYPDQYYDKYRYLTRYDNGEVHSTFPLGAHGAVVLEVLIQQDAEILALLRECRKNPGLIPQLAERMNTIEPGIYERLNNVRDDDPGIYEIAETITEPILAKRLGLRPIPRP